MKKIFTLMLAFACALFVGVSCTTDDTIGDTPIPTIPVLKVNGLVIGTPNAGTCDLAYAIENAQDGIEVKVEVDAKGAEWLTAEAVDEKVVLTYTENTTDKSRLATLYISYGAAETVHVAVKQVGQVYLEVLDIPETGVIELDPFGTMYAEKLVLSYIMHTEAQDAELSVKVSEGAAWLKSEVSAEAVTISYDGNATDAAREAVIELSFEGAEPVVLAVKQAVAVPALTVAGAPEANLDGKAGSFNLTCEIDKPIDLTLGVEVSTEADWLHIGELAGDGITYPITYDANLSDPGSEPREGVIKFSYKNAEDVFVIVKQEPQPAMFTVDCKPETLSCGYADILVSAVDPEMLYLAVTSQELGQYGVMGENKVELMNNYMTLLAQNSMLPSQPDNYFVYKGNMADAGVSKQASRYTAEDNVTVYVVGFAPVTTVEVEEGGEKLIFVTEAKLATSIIEYVVPFLPYPTLTVPEAQLSNNVTAAAGEVVVDCVLTNALSDGTAVELQTEAAWVRPTWADNKLTIAYDENTTAVARRAKIAVMYGNYTNPFEVTVVQEKDPNAVAVTLTITVKGTQFNGILVDVVPSDPTATYALNITTPEKDWETGAELPIDWMSKAEDLLSYTGTATFHTGNLTDHFIKTNVSNYEWYGLEYYVYAIPVAATSEGDNWTVSQILGEAAVSEKVTIDTSKMPKVDWVVEGSGLVRNEDADRYDLEVVEGSTVTLSFTVTNPVEGASLKLNGTSLYDSYNVVNGEPVVDNAAGTITFNIDAFDTSKKYHYVNPTFKYTNEADDNWGVMLPSLRITQVQAPAADTPATPAE